MSSLAEALSRPDGFVERFNRGLYFEAHEAAEEIWIERGRKKTDPVRGLVQLAVALAHAERGNLSGARRVLERATGLLKDSTELRLDAILKAAWLVVNGNEVTVPQLRPENVS